MAAPTYGATGAAASTPVGGVLSIPFPAGVAAGDLLVAVVGVAASIALPSGWTNLAHDTSAGILNARAFCKVAAGSESGSQPVMIGAAAPDTSGNMFRIAGVGTAPIDVASAWTSGATGPSVTTTDDERLVVAVILRAGTGNTFTPPSGFLERFDRQSQGGTVAAAVATKTQTAEGASGTTSWSASGTNSSTRTLTFAVAPAAPLVSASIERRVAGVWGGGVGRREDGVLVPRSVLRLSGGTWS